MKKRIIGDTELEVSPIGFGAFKIGRNESIKYPDPYQLPDDTEVERFLDDLWDLGINYFDTAPAYGSSEERIGRWIAKKKRPGLVISTKAGETFANGISTFDFSTAGMRRSVERSVARLNVDAIDLVFIHSSGDDLRVQRDSNAVEVLQDLKREGLVRYIGFSGKTVEGFEEAFGWADAIMVEYSSFNAGNGQLIKTAGEKNVGVVVKKGLGQGNLPPMEAINFLFANPGVDCAAIGSLNYAHMRENLRFAEAALK